MDSDFGDWKVHAAWLGEMGYTVSWESVRRYGNRLRQDPIRLARLLRENTT